MRRHSHHTVAFHHWPWLAPNSGIAAFQLAYVASDQLIFQVKQRAWDALIQGRTQLRLDLAAILRAAVWPEKPQIGAAHPQIADQPVEPGGVPTVRPAGA
ncbi:MAG: hypothetical protein FJ011_15165 [Chloroflexi bacterium]|nr:hypothetical protein [Chloroflexota bacterium]